MLERIHNDKTREVDSGLKKYTMSILLQKNEKAMQYELIYGQLADSNHSQITFPLCVTYSSISSLSDFSDFKFPFRLLENSSLQII